MWRASVLTIFPGDFSRPLGREPCRQGLASGMWSLDVIDIRSFATDKHRTVDDTPAGGGPGMVMKADVLGRAIDATATDQRPRLLLSPRGFAANPRPRRDARRRTRRRPRLRPLRRRSTSGLSPAASMEEVSVGDYVLSGGEVAAMALDRRLRAAVARRDGRRRFRRRRELRGRPTGVSAIYAAAGLGGPTDPRSSSLRRPRQDRRLAACRGRTAHARRAGPTSGGVHSGKFGPPAREPGVTGSVTKPAGSVEAAPTR